MTLFQTSPASIELVTVPAGEFIMGLGTGQNAPESPAHTVFLAEYQIGKYPVTNAQYAPFLLDTGHSAPITWENGQFPKSRADHPVCGITWTDAWVFCAWLRYKTNMPFHLPTEAQWEKAATWNEAEKRKYHFPWGNDFSGTRCNLLASESHEKREPFVAHGHMVHATTQQLDVAVASNQLGTTPVGAYSPVGDSFYGCADMIGNVDEWCNSDMREYPYQTEDGREALAPGLTGRKCIRGGDWFTLVAQSGIRRNVPDEIWLPLWGFRVAVSSEIDEAGQKLEQTIGQMEMELKKTYTAKIKKAAAKGYAAWGQGLLDLHLLFGVDRLQQSEQMFTKAIEAVQKSSSKGFWRKRPDKILGFPFFHIYYNRGLVRQALGKHEDALHDLTQAIELESSDADLFMLRAKIHGELGRSRAAETDLRKGLRLHPNHPFEREARIRIACGKQEWETALALLSQSIAEAFFIPPAPYRPEFYLWRAECYEQMHEQDKAVSDYYHYLICRPDASEKDDLTRKIEQYKEQQKPYRHSKQSKPTAASTRTKRPQTSAQRAIITLVCPGCKKTYTYDSAKIPPNVTFAVCKVCGSRVPLP